MGLPGELIESMYHERTILGVDPDDLPPAPPAPPPAPEQPLGVLFPEGYLDKQGEPPAASRTIMELRERTAERQAAAKRLREEMATLREQAARLRAGAAPPTGPASPATPAPRPEQQPQMPVGEPDAEHVEEQIGDETDEQDAVEETTPADSSRRRWRRRERRRGTD
jgi:hypothetical protein